jgi:hypothetical protein
MTEAGEAQIIAANTWNAAIDTVARLVDQHYSGSHNSPEHAKLAKGDMWVYDTDIGNLVRSIRSAHPTPSKDTNE